MGDVRGFLTISKEDVSYRPVEERLKDYREVTIPLREEKVKAQGARCMDCGVPTCHWGCPVDNLIPDWNDLVYRGRWQDALERLLRHKQFARDDRPCVSGALRSIVRARIDRAAGQHQAQ